MSQEKVDRYKQEKATRKQTLAKNKVKRLIATICGWAVAIALLSWVGYSAITTYQANKPKNTYFCDTTAIDDYLTSLSE